MLSLFQVVASDVFLNKNLVVFVIQFRTNNIRFVMYSFIDSVTVVDYARYVSANIVLYCIARFSLGLFFNT